MLALLLACHGASTGDDSGPADTTADPATVPLTGACPMESDDGGFAVVADGKTGSITGSVADGVVPASVLETLGSDGGCAVLRRDNPFCDPACSAGTTCDFDGACVPYPSNQDLGKVTVTGLVEPVSMDPVFPGNTYFDTELPSEPFTGGALVTLSAPDASLVLHGVGVDALTPLDASWSIDETKDLVVRWAMPTSAVVRSEIGLEVSIDVHGVTPSVLRCTFDDTGEGTVPAKVLASLVGAGVTGFPNGTLTRRTYDHTAFGKGCADLEIASPRSVPVDVLGYTPCVTTAECPKGQTCNKELEVCE